VLVEYRVNRGWADGLSVTGVRMPQ
jgi:hypothetical protein